MRPALIVIAGLLAALAVAMTPAVSPAAQGWDEGFVIAKIKEFGALIELEDGSIWRVPRSEEQDTVYNRWLPYQEVAIRKDQSEMLNTITGERVDVTSVSKAVRPRGRPEERSQAEYKAMAAQQARGQANQALEKEIKRIYQRLEGLDAKLSVMDWRMRQIENQLMISPDKKAQ